MPRPLRRWVQHFEASIEDAVEGFAQSLPDGARVLDAGAGEANHKRHFARQRYIGFDLAIGDADWDYSRLDAVGDLSLLPFRDGVFEGCLSIVTLEHVQQPARVVCEMARALAPGGRILIVAPHEWEEHQQPHDYFRYTRFGLRLLLEQAGLVEISIQPVAAVVRSVAVLSRASDFRRRDILRAPGAADAAAGSAGSQEKLYTGVYMFRAKATLISLVTTASMFGAAPAFSGASALEFTRQAVAFGPRPSGSEANRKLQAYITSELQKDGCELSDDSFTARTFRGAIPMKNILCKFPGRSGKAIAITGHFDTKLYPGRHFVGANDGGSSTGLLLELAHALAHQPRVDDVYIVFFDGEEALGEWSASDSVYGSKHLADRWKQDGTAKRMKALINVDMIGDKSLNIKQEPDSNAALIRLVWGAAADLGYSHYFLDESQEIEDDHLPFIKIGIPSIDIIDFDYPPWHEDDDTMDKLSAKSLEIVGAVMLESIKRLER